MSKLVAIIKKLYLCELNDNYIKYIPMKNVVKVGFLCVAALLCACKSSDTVLLPLHQRIELQELVLLPIALAQILGQVAEHGAVLHVMAAEDQVVAGRIGVAQRIQYDLAVDVLLAVEVVAQVIIAVLALAHDRIVDHSVRDRDPAHQVMIQLVNLLQLRQYGRFVQLDLLLHHVGQRPGANGAIRRGRRHRRRRGRRGLRGLRRR